MFASLWSDIWATVGQNIGQIAALLGAGVLIIILEQLRLKASEYLKHRRLHPIARSLVANRAVNTILIETRTKLDADRARVILFHNGQVFSNKNPLWRCSCTQEVCREGISHEMESMQNVLASTMWETLAPLFIPENNIKGMRLLRRCNPCTDCKQCKERAYLVDIHQLEDSYFKRRMVQMGVVTNLIAPIMDNQSNVVGYVGINFNEQKTLPSDKELLETIAGTAARIHFALTED